MTAPTFSVKVGLVDFSVIVIDVPTGVCWRPLATFGGSAVLTDEILTLQDVADLLKVGMKTAYTMAQQGKLPGFKVGQQWRFQASDIGAWIDAQKAAARKPRRRRVGR